MTGDLRPTRRFGLIAALAMLLVSVGLGAGPAAAKRAENHCISPAGDDLNEVFGTRDAFVAPFCTEVHVGDRWRAVLRAQVAGEDSVFPSGYTPAVLPLDEDFLAKFIGSRYVVDAGTARERSYSFSAQRLVIENGGLPDGTRFVRWISSSLHPLPPGEHTVDEYVTLSADFWDGLGLDPALNLSPAGETLVGSVSFEVVKR